MEYNDSGCIYSGNWLYIGLVRIWCYWRNIWKRAYWRHRGIPQYGCGFYSGKGIQLPEFDVDRKNAFDDLTYVILPWKEYVNAKGIQLPVRKKDEIR